MTFKDRMAQHNAGMRTQVMCIVPTFLSNIFNYFYVFLPYFPFKLIFIKRHFKTADPTAFPIDFFRSVMKRQSSQKLVRFHQNGTITQ